MPDVLDALRHRLAMRAALRAVRARAVRPLPLRLRQRRLLVVLPTDQAALRPAWRLVLAFDLPARNVQAVSMDGHAAYVPDPFAGAVRLLGERDRDWLGLPTRAVLASVWGARPDVAIDLSLSFDLAAAALVGGAPASFRAGLYDERAEPFFDFLLTPAGGAEASYSALRHYLEAVDPPALPFRE